MLLGRNGALILGDIPTALHVQVDAPVQLRIARAAREAGIDQAHAARRQRNEDQFGNSDDPLSGTSFLAVAGVLWK